MRRDFWAFWTGQSISAFGSSISLFAVPLLVFQLTGSSIYLGIAFAAEMLPYPLLGLLIGAWADRTDRKRLMILTDIGRALVIGSIPLAAALGILSVWWIFAAGFISTTLTIAFQSAEFAAIPALVDRDDLVTANGRIQASFAAATVLGPVAAGGLLAFVTLPTLLALDAASYVASAVSVAVIQRRLQGERAPGRTSLRADVMEGLRYVIKHPVLRNISAMMALVNFVGTAAFAQLVYFASARFDASESEISVLFSAGGAGVIVFSLAAGALRRRWSFGVVALGALTLGGLCTAAMAMVPAYEAAVILWAASSGTGILFNINTASLRQAIVPEHMLGRVISIASVLAWSANPLGALAGGFAVAWTGNVALLFIVAGLTQSVIALSFFVLSPLGRAERYLPARPAEAAT